MFRAGGLSMNNEWNSFIFQMKKWRQNSGPMTPLLPLTPSSPWVSSSLATILWERGRGRSGSTQCAPSYVRSRQPPHAFLDQVLASHCLLGFYGKEVSFKFSLWPHVQGNRSRFLPLLHDWILLSSCLKKIQMSGSPISTSTELSLLLLREADIQCILKLEEVLKVRLGTQLHS